MEEIIQQFNQVCPERRYTPPEVVKDESGGDEEEEVEYYSGDLEDVVEDKVDGAGRGRVELGMAIGGVGLALLVVL